MNTESNKVHFNDVQTLLTASIGPVADCRDKLWSGLVDFAFWPQRIPALRDLVITRPKTLGRGSELVLIWNDARQVANISYWHPGQQLELVISEQESKTGLRFALQEGQDPEHIKLLLEYEVSHTGSWPLWNRLIRQRRIKKLNSRLRDLVSSFQNLS